MWGDVGCECPCRCGTGGLQQDSAARGSPSPALPLASHRGTLRQHLLQTSATGGPGLPASCWPNPSRCHPSHLPGDSWGPSGVTHSSTRAPWLQWSCVRPSRMRARATGSAGTAPHRCPESAVGSATVPLAHTGPLASQTVHPGVSHGLEPRHTAEPRWCVPARLPVPVLRGGGTCRSGAGGCGAGTAALPSSAKGMGCTSPAAVLALARGATEGAGWDLSPSSPAAASWLGSSMGAPAASDSGHLRGSGAGTGRRAGPRGNASPSSEQERGCTPTAREKGPGCGCQRNRVFRKVSALFLDLFLQAAACPALLCVGESDVAGCGQQWGEGGTTAALQVPFQGPGLLRGVSAPSPSTQPGRPGAQPSADTSPSTHSCWISP